MGYDLKVKVAISGKGGTGKTSISGTLARLAARRGYSTLAIDCDSNPNLGASLGLDYETLAGITPLPKMVRGSEAVSAESLIQKYGVPAADGVTLVIAARVEEAGGG